MSATDPIITLSTFVKLEFPDGDVRLCDGGMISYDGEVYHSQHDVFGSLAGLEAFETGFGDMAESGELVLAPIDEFAFASEGSGEPLGLLLALTGAGGGSYWLREDLLDCRVRAWQGVVDSDLYTVSAADQLGDYYVDNIVRDQGPGGQNLLRLPLIGRAEKLFLKREGNVCSERHHKTVWAGEDGFNNCTDLQGFVAWGAMAPARGGTTTWRG
jgi:hypothetical protein